MCLNPIYLQKLGFSVSCGKCIFCQMSKKRDWKLRCLLESTSHAFNSFVTLTYDDEHLVSNSLVKSDLQLFFKRLRKRLNNSIKFKYFACGEYGEDSLRPHFHILFFGLSDSLADYYCHLCWDKGLIDIGFLSSRSISYVVGYTVKKVFDDLDFYSRNNLQPPFQLLSQSLGSDYIESHLFDIISDKFVRLGPHKYPIPQFFRRKYNIDIKDSVSEYFEQLDRDIYEKYHELAYNIYDSDDLSYCRKLYNQYELQSKAIFLKNVLTNSRKCGTI